MNENARFTIGLLRHGETEGGARYRGNTDDCLTETGWRQMRDALVDTRDWEMIVTSPLVRCADFARAFAAERRLPLRIDKRLREIDFGVWEGRTAAEIMDSVPDALADFWRDPWNHGPPGGEPLAQMHERVLAAWHDIVAPRRPTLVIAHGGPMRVILCHALGLPLAQLLHVDVPPAVLHRLDLRAHDAAVVDALLP